MKLLWNYYIIHRIHVIVHYIILICISYCLSYNFFQFPVQFFTYYLKLSPNIDIGTWAPPIPIFESCKMSLLKFCDFNDMHVIVSNPFKRHIIVTFSHSNLVFIHLLKLIWQTLDFVTAFTKLFSFEGKHANMHAYLFKYELLDWPT